MLGMVSIMELSTVFMPFVTLLTCQIIVLELGKFRFPMKKIYLIMVIELVLQTAVCDTILIIFGYHVYSMTYSITMDIPAILLFIYVSKRRDLRDAFTFLITIFVGFAISIPSMWISQLLGGGFFWYDIIRILIFVLFLIIIHKYVRVRYREIQDEMVRGWGIFSILPIIGSAVLYYEYLVYGRDGNFSEVGLICLFDILMMTMVFIVFNFILKELHEKYLVQEQKRILDIQNKAQWDQFEQQREANEKMNRRWHDLRHSTQQLIDLLEAGNAETALTYLKEQRGIDQVQREDYCLHPAVNSIICLWVERCKKAGIKVEVKTDIPDKLEIDPMELSALFANALENAYEGCMRLPEEANRFLRIEANYNGKRLAIGVENSCVKEIFFENNMPVSMKKSGGIGTRSMIYTVQRFNGTSFFEAKEGIFKARFVLNISLPMTKCAI